MKRYSRKQLEEIAFELAKDCYNAAQIAWFLDFDSDGRVFISVNWPGGHGARLL